MLQQLVQVVPLVERPDEGIQFAIRFPDHLAELAALQPGEQLPDPLHYLGRFLGRGHGAMIPDGMDPITRWLATSGREVQPWEIGIVVGLVTIAFVLADALLVGL